MSSLAAVDSQCLYELGRALDQLGAAIAETHRRANTELGSVEAELDREEKFWRTQGHPASNRVVEFNLTKIARLRVRLGSVKERQKAALRKLDQALPLIKKAQAELKRLNQTLQHYSRAASDLEEKKKAIGWIGVAGIVGEAGGLISMGRGARNLNEKRANYHIFDLISDQGIASVKTKVDRESAEARYRAYYDDFSLLLGYGEGPLTMDDASLLRDTLKRYRDLPVPGGMSGEPTDEQIFAYLRDESLLYIPDDDVDDFKSWLLHNKQASEQTCARIRSLGLTNADIRGLRDDFFHSRAN